MSQGNSAKCPSCGAFVNSRANRCPYCRTSILPFGSITPHDFGKAIAESAKLDLRRDLDDSLKGTGQLSRTYSVAAPPAATRTATTTTTFAMPEQKEEYATSQLSIISYGPQFEVEFRRRRESPGDIVEARPLQHLIRGEAIEGLENVYIGNILRSSETMGQQLQKVDEKEREELLDTFRNSLLTFGQLLSNALGNEIVGSIASLNEGSRIQLRLDESALGIPWELAWLGEWVEPKSENIDRRFLGQRYSTGKTVVWTPSPDEEPPQMNARRASPATNVLMIDAATDPYDNPGLKQIKSFAPVIEYFEKDLKKKGANVSTIWGAAATHYNVCEALKGDNDIVIINTHGYFEPGDAQEPTTGLYLHDKMLSCQEIRDVYKASRYEAPLLWVCYACETGTQRAWTEGRDSLPSTLNRLNVPLVAPYWPAWSGSSDYLLAGFFERVFDANPSPLGDALLAAKLDLYDSKWSMFSDWANWTLYGNPGLAIGLGQ